MNRKLRQQAALLPSAGPEFRPLRITFGVACAERVRHLLTDPRVVACLDVGQAFLRGARDDAALLGAAAESKALAGSHPGFGSTVDTGGHAAVSATHAVAKALNDDPLGAADYAAYAAVYAYGGHAVGDPRAYEPEYQWQLARIEELLAQPLSADPT